MGLKKLVGLSLLVTCALFSCKKLPGTVPANTIYKDPDVYVAGNTTYGTNFVAAYWKNNTEVILAPTAAFSNAKAIFVQGTDVFVAGMMAVDGVQKAVYWKNGKAVILGDGLANSIAVNGNDVYVAGSSIIYRPGLSYEAATYWKNGLAVLLNNPVDKTGSGGESFVNGIVVDGMDVYLAGLAEAAPLSGKYSAIYWKNGVGRVLPTTNSQQADYVSIAKGIAVQDGDVYISGSITPFSGKLSSPGDISGPVYWKNDDVVPLANGVTYTYTGDIAVLGPDVYVAGLPNDNDNAGVFWKNGTPTNLIINVQPAAHASLLIQPLGIALFNNDVYVAGCLFNVDAGILGKTYGVYWKNGHPFILSSSSSAQANAIVVVPHP